MNTIICFICLILAAVCFYFGVRKGYLAIYISRMSGGLRPELIFPLALLGAGFYLLYQAYIYLPFIIVWK